MIGQITRHLNTKHSTTYGAVINISWNSDKIVIVSWNPYFKIILCQKEHFIERIK